MIGKPPADLFLEQALLPLLALEVMIVAFYIVYVTRTWRGMPWREAVIYAPLAIPLGFLAFFVIANASAGSRPLASFAEPLAIITLVPWLAGTATGAVTYWRVKQRQD